MSSTDEEELRNLVVWLEDQKIRLYTIEGRADLRDMKSDEWMRAFSKVSVQFYMNDEMMK